MPVAVDNKPEEFPPQTFSLVGFCDCCGHSGAIDRSLIPAGVSVQALPGRLRCSRCGARETSMRIVYTGAGGFRHSGATVVAGLGDAE
jgi:hypothetical protein